MLENFAPSAVVGLTALPDSLNVVLPGTGVEGGPSTALVTNLGPGTAFVVLGADASVVASVETGVAVLPDESVPLAIGPTNTHLAAITEQSSTPAVLNIAVGT
jgi:hypothetical protein